MNQYNLLTTLWRSVRNWWLYRGLHDDCIVFQAAIDCGESQVPYGACTACEPRLAKLRALRLPAARARYFV